VTMPNKTKSLTFPCIKIEQPIGVFFVGSIKSCDLCEITYSDVRQIDRESGFDTYLGIQRPLNARRVREIAQYVGSADACFPTAVILAVPAECTHFDEDEKTMKLSEDPARGITFQKIAKIIDGQHRIEGLRGFEEDTFEVNVSIFVDMDIADQGYLFSTVNLAQTKVNRSLVFDLYELAKSRSPQKICHEIAVALDNNESSPFYERIKRLGVATEGRFNEKITQATFVQALLKYISKDPMGDRNLYLTGRHPKKVEGKEAEKLIFRNMFIEEQDLEITDVVWNFFEAVHECWPRAWDHSGKGSMLSQTNGFRALMRFLRPCYLHLASPGAVVGKEQFLTELKKINMKSEDFSVETYKPGSSGESKLYRALVDGASFD
jgi:DGQHR domain-containing protein